jgi:hypothetical protein
MIILFRVYNTAQAPDKKPRVRVTVELQRDGKLAAKPFEFELTELTPEPVPHVAFAKFIKLTGLTPGKYKAIIETRDMVKLRLSKAETSFEIVP